MRNTHITISRCNTHAVRLSLTCIAAATALLSALPATAQKYPPVKPEPPPNTDPAPAPSPTPAPAPEAETDSRANNELIARATQPSFFVGAAGPSFFGINGADRAPGFRQTAFFRGKIALDYGYHVSGGGDGFALGVGIEQSFDSNFYVVNPGFKMWWDIRVTDLAIFVVPFGKLGYAFGACSDCSTNNHAFNVALGAEGRMVFDDRWMVLFRPVQLDTYFGNFFDEVFLIHYDILVGGGLTF